MSMGIRHSSYPVYSHKIGGFSKQCFLDRNISIKVSKQKKALNKPVLRLLSCCVSQSSFCRNPCRGNDVTAAWTLPSGWEAAPHHRRTLAWSPACTRSSPWSLWARPSTGQSASCTSHPGHCVWQRKQMDYIEFRLLWNFIAFELREKTLIKFWCLVLHVCTPKCKFNRRVNIQLFRVQAKQNNSKW